MKPLFYCCECWVGSYEKDNLTMAGDCLHGWNRPGELKTDHCVHMFDSDNLSDRGKVLKEYALTHLVEDDRKGLN